MGVLGDIQYRAALVWKVLNGNTTTTRKFLRQVGTGAASAAPGWDTLQAADLPSTAVTPASYGDATHVAAFTVDQQGRLTAASSVAITDTGITTLTGDVTAGPGSGSQAATLANTTVTPASYTNTNLTVDSKGRITAASNGSAGGSGTVTNTGTLTNHALIKGNGTVDVSALGSLGTTTTVLHGNAAGDPTFGAVVEADITLANNTTNNVSTSAHGFAPILPNDSAKYLDGTGAYTSPAGSGATAVPIVVTANAVVTTNNGWVIPESLEIAAGVILEIQGGARVEITGRVGLASNALLGFVAYAAATDVALHVQSSNTLTAMDAANVSVSFIAPASGKVEIRASVIHSVTAASGDCYWGLLEGATTIATSYMGGPGGVAWTHRTELQFYVTGLVNGSSHTYALAHRVTANSVTAFTGPTFGFAVMEVYGR